jgi:hypothetical protein
MAKGNLTQKHSTTKWKIDRRSFLKKITAALGGMTRGIWGQVLHYNILYSTKYFSIRDRSSLLI